MKKKEKKKKMKYLKKKIDSYVQRPDRFNFKQIGKWGERVHNPDVNKLMHEDYIEEYEKLRLNK